MTSAMIIIGIGLILIGLSFVFREQLKGWRTVIWNALLGSSPVLLAMFNQIDGVDWSRVFTPLNAILAGVLIAGLGTWLRAITDTPIGKKD